MIGDMENVMGIPMGITIGLCSGPVKVWGLGYSAVSHISPVMFFIYSPNLGAYTSPSVQPLKVRPYNVGEKLALLTYNVHLLSFERQCHFLCSL